MTQPGIVGVPRVPEGLVVREALLSRVGNSPLTVIRAPGGSGKTVLMAQWAVTGERSGAWVTVEPDIGDRSAFWAAVAEAAGVRLVDTDRSAVLAAFRAITDPFVLVVDDAHELRDPTIIDDLLAVVRASRTLSIVVGTRSRSELEAPAQALTLDIAVIEPDELLLGLDEVRQLMGAEGSPYGSPEHLLEASGGNPLLLRAILAGSSGVSPDAVVRDHLRVLFADAGSEFATVVSAASVPDDFDIASAERLSGIDRGSISEFLVSLETDGLIMRRVDASGPRYRFHPLVRDVLRGGLRAEHPDTFARVSLLASAEAEGRKHYIAALRHAVEAEEYVRASDIVLHGGFSLIRARGAAAILQKVPLRYVARLPFLAVVLGLAANARGERLRALELLGLALAASRAGRGRQRLGERAGLALIETVVLRITGRAADAVPAARRMLEILDEAPPADLEEIGDQLGAYRYQGAVSMLRAGRIDEARTAAERVGVSSAALEEGTPDALGAAALIALVDSARGRTSDAVMMLDRIDAAGFPDELRDGYVGSLAHLARGILALEAGDAEGAAFHAEQFRDGENLEFGMLFTVLRSLTELWREHPDLAMRALDQKERADRSRARMSAEDRRVVSLARVLLHAALGQGGAAHATLRGLDRGQPVTAVLHATLLIQEQNPERAIERLSATTVGSSPRLQAAVDILTASASLLRDDIPLATAGLRRFLAGYELHAIASPVVLVPVELREPLWALARRLDTDPDVIARLAGIPAPLALTSSRAALTPREEEVLRRLRDTASLTEIAASLSVSSNTVKTQVRTLYRKLEVANRDEALRAANLHGLLRD